jgi:NADPH:quinone reductase-like Zn-dependent oxidoreductase
MRAVVIDRFATPGQVRDVPPPVVEPDAIVVRITVAGINPIDWKVRDGKAGDRPFPLVLGQDFAGVVESAGDRVHRVKAGDRVFGIARDHGSYAGRTLVRDDLHDSPFSIIPDGVTDEQAAALPTPGLTALASIAALEVGEGTEILILGAGGSVGCTAVQIARGKGARVTAVVRANQRQRVLDLGAREAVESIDGLKPGTFDAVLDLISDGETLKKNAPLLKKDGLLVTTIHVADVDWFRAHGVTAINIGLAETPESSPQGLDELAQLVAERKLAVEVAGEKPLSDAAAVLDAVKAGKLSGKIVLKV